MKRYLFLAAIGIFSIFLSSCKLDDEGYSLNDAWVGFGILQKDTKSILGYSIKLDEGDKVIPTSSNIWLTEFKDSSRVLINYTILGEKADSVAFKEYYVKINSMREILMKGILDITDKNKDSIGNDPVIVKYAWISNNLLNFELKYWGDHEVHFINLVKHPGVLAANSQPIELELRHNSNGDPEKIPFVAYVSFDLSALKIAGVDSVRFKVKATDYEGDLYSDEGVFKYGNN
jgi:hypothetical protein